MWISFTGTPEQNQVRWRRLDPINARPTHSYIIDFFVGPSGIWRGHNTFFALYTVRHLPSIEFLSSYQYTQAAYTHIFINLILRNYGEDQEHSVSHAAVHISVGTNWLHIGLATSTMILPIQMWEREAI